MKSLTTDTQLRNLLHEIRVALQLRKADDLDWFELGLPDSESSIPTSTLSALNAPQTPTRQTSSTAQLHTPQGHTIYPTAARTPHTRIPTNSQTPPSSGQPGLQPTPEEKGIQRIRLRHLPAEAYSRRTMAAELSLFLKTEVTLMGNASTNYIDIENDLFYTLFASSPYRDWVSKGGDKIRLESVDQKGQPFHLGIDTDNTNTDYVRKQPFSTNALARNPLKRPRSNSAPATYTQYTPPSYNTSSTTPAKRIYHTSTSPKPTPSPSSKRGLRGAPSRGRRLY